MKYAQEMDGWSTTLELADHLANITKLLYKRGAEEVMANYSPRRKVAVVQFEWAEEVYRIVYRPLEPEIKRRSNEDGLIQQALRQMGFIATLHVKSLLNLALEGMHPEMAMPYTCSLTEGGPTLQELGVQGFKEMLLAANDGTLALNARNKK